MGCISGVGDNLAAHIQGLKGSERNCRLVPPWLFATKHPYPVFVGPENPLTTAGATLLSQLDPPSALPRTSCLLLSALAEALEMAELSLDDIRRLRVGIAIGTTVGCTFNDEDYYQSFRQGERRPIDPVLNYLNGNLAAQLQAILGCKGPSLVVTNACASGTDAIGIAGGWLRAGLCDLAIAGGADELSRIAYNGFSSLQLCASEACRPFAAERTGLNLGEGAGVLILEPQGRDHIQGWLRGYGANSDAWHATAPHPEGQGLVRAAAQALSGLPPEGRLALINAHGTGTQANDLAENKALQHIIPSAGDTAVVSTKGWTGHTLGAAGALEAIFTLLALQDGQVPGTLGCKEQDPAFKVDISPQGENRALRSRFGLSQSLAFGGCNSALLMEARP